MIVINGKPSPTVADAAKEFCVAAKTVHDWIEKGIISHPPTMQYGVRPMQVFPPDYMKTAKRELAGYQKMKAQKRPVLSRS
jgi:hypothetical protein